MPSLATLPKDLAKFARYHLVRRAETYPARETDLGIEALAFDLDRYVEQIRAFDDARFEVTTLASVAYRDRVHPILRVRSRRAAAKTLLVLSGVHGNEHAGLLAVPAILEAWSSERVRVVVITPVNPVGAAELSRFNAEGYDINRDFVRFGTPEARVVRDVFDVERPDFVISLHEGPQDATFMFANRFVDASLAAALCNDLAAGGTVLAEKDYFGLRLDPPGLSASSATGRMVTKLWALTLGMKATIAYSEDRGIPEIVLESSWRTADEASRVRPHVDLVVAVAGQDLRQTLSRTRRTMPRIIFEPSSVVFRRSRVFANDSAEELRTERPLRQAHAMLLGRRMNPVSHSSRLVAVVAGAVALAACSSSSKSSSAETTAAKVELAHAEELDKLDRATQVVTNMKGEIPADVASGTKCVVVFPKIVKAGVIIGGQGGKGYATCESANGWSSPAPISIGGGTLGVQIGGQSMELVALVKSDKGMKALETGNFRVGVDASAAAGPVGAGRGSSTGISQGGDLVSYSHASGLYAGANLDGTTIKSDKDSTQALYGSQHDLKTLLSGSVPAPKDPAVQRFLGAAQSFGTGRRMVSSAP